MIVHGGLARAIRRGVALALLAIAASLAPAPALADRTEPLPAELLGVGVEDRVGARLPLETTFRDEAGASVRLGELFGRGRPVLVTLNYSSCPMLCNLQIEGLVEAMLGMDWSIGRDFDVVTVSIDPSETAERAAKTKRKYLGYYGRPGAEGGWRFLTGDEASIQALAAAVGFGYRYLPAKKEFAHAAALFFCAPDGRLARTITGVRYASSDLRLALVESAQGRLGGFSDMAVLFCFKYDPAAQKYTLAALAAMRTAGLVAVAAIGAFLLVLHRRSTASLRVLA